MDWHRTILELDSHRLVRTFHQKPAEVRISLASLEHRQNTCMIDT